jgi:hypothetical protein
VNLVSLGAMNIVPNPANEIAREAAADVRSLILSHVHATDLGVDAVFNAGLESVVSRSLQGVDLDSVPTDSVEYQADVLASFSYIVRSLALQAATVDPEGTLRRLMAEYEERDTTF